MARENNNEIKNDVEDGTEYEYDDDIRERDISDKKGFLDGLKKKAETIKNKGVDLGKTTAKGAEGLGNKIDNVIDESMNTAKGLGTSKNETLDLIERLAKMKEDGILTEREFTEKKKELLEKI